MNVLEVQGLTKRYPAFTLDHVSFDVPQGAVMGFIGRNGAGKSTTLKSILGMVHPDEGAVRVFGMDYAANEAAIRRELGVVLGGIDFYPKKKVGTITDVTRRFYSNWDEKKYRHYLELFAIDESKRVDQLSSGMKVKYMIALALSHNARLLILDEPTNGLDPAGIQEMRELIRSLPGRFGMTVVVSSHLLSEIDQMADHVGIIREGRLVFQDTLSALHARSCPRLALRTTDNAGAARLLGENRVPCTLEDGWLTLPLLSDADAASLSRFLASHRVDLLRMEERQKSLEDLFLELTGREESL